VLMLLMTVVVLRCIIKVLSVFKQISPEAVDFQEMLLMSYMLHRAEIMVSSVCLNVREEDGFKVWKKFHQPELCTHCKLQLGPKMVITEHILTFYCHCF